MEIDHVKPYHCKELHEPECVSDSTDALLSAEEEGKPEHAPNCLAMRHGSPGRDGYLCNCKPEAASAVKTKCPGCQSDIGDPHDHPCAYDPNRYADERGGVEQERERAEAAEQNLKDLQRRHDLTLSLAEQLAERLAEAERRERDLSDQLAAEKEEHQRNRERRDRYKAKAFAAWDRARALERERDAAISEIGPMAKRIVELEAARDAAEKRVAELEQEKTEHLRLLSRRVEADRLSEANKRIAELEAQLANNHWRNEAMRIATERDEARAQLAEWQQKANQREWAIREYDAAHRALDIAGAAKSHGTQQTLTIHTRIKDLEHQLQQLRAQLAAATAGEVLREGDVVCLKAIVGEDDCGTVLRGPDPERAMYQDHVLVKWSGQPGLFDPRELCLVRRRVLTSEEGEASNG